MTVTGSSSMHTVYATFFPGICHWETNKTIPKKKKKKNEGQNEQNEPHPKYTARSCWQSLASRWCSDSDHHNQEYSVIRVKVYTFSCTLKLSKMKLQINEFSKNNHYSIFIICYERRRVEEKWWRPEKYRYIPLYTIDLPYEDDKHGSYVEETRWSTSRPLPHFYWDRKTKG